LTFKDFDLNADFYGNAGNKIYNGKKAFRYDSRDNIESDYVNNRWTPQNTGGSEPRILSTATPASTYFIEPADFLRLNNLTLGYTISKRGMERWGLNSLRVYITSQNLFTITPYSGFTPADLPGSSPLNAGIELNAYPTSRTFGAGVNLTF
jgi:hypothetical protein